MESNWKIGDVEVFVQNGVYHLFHLVLPSYNRIAHATSTDGITWTPVEDALALGSNEEWDNLMIRTLDVFEKDNQFHMYYAGMQIGPKENNQKIGMATSSNLLDWTKTENNIIESAAPFYEDIDNNPRGWISFRDPFHFEINDSSYLLVCSRYAHGPVSRRGSVGLYKKENNEFIPQAPLLVPMAFDDVESPCMFEIDGKFYLIGSIREDVKVRYWRADEFQGEYKSFHHDTLLPQGNYAARVVNDGDHILIYNLYFHSAEKNAQKSLPPPKELMLDKKGRLRLKSYYRWEEKCIRTIQQFEILSPRRLFNNPTSKFENIDNKWVVSSRSGYELFTFEKPSESFIWEGIIEMEGLGKGGLVMDTDQEGNGYFISFDFVSGYVQIRSWGFNPEDTENNFIFENLQSNQFRPRKNDYRLHFKLIKYGSYIELSIDGEIKLTLMDFTYKSNEVGLYTCSSSMSVEYSNLKVLPNPDEEYGSNTSHE